MQHCRRVALWAVVLLVALPAQAQLRQSETRILNYIPTDPQSELLSHLNLEFAKSGLFALEGTVDAKDYVVGPGDVFQISVGGLVQLEIAARVSVSGVLAIPEAGLLNAGGRSLDVVLAEAELLLKAHYSNAPVTIALGQPRSFFVHLTGAALRQGRFLMLPASRVSDVVEQAYTTGVVAAPVTGEDAEFMAPSSVALATMGEDYQPALRNVRVVHTDGKVTIVDLVRYQTTGDTAYNPYLRDGDRVTIPAFRPDEEGVWVSGGIGWPGSYDWREDDTVLSLLDLASGGRALESFTDVRLVRRHTGSTPEVIVLDIPAMVRGETAPVGVRPGDHVAVYKEETATATVEGRVNYPGVYRIEGGVTTLRELVTMAGGLKPDASVRSAVLERQSVQELVEPPESREEEPDVFLSQSDRLFFSQGFQLPFSGAIGTNVATDLEGALDGSAEDIILFAGDRLVIPRDEGTVFVTGHVPQPGYVAHLPGMTARYYIERAGGMGPAARGVYVFQGSSQRIREGNDTPVYSGDTIFVDRPEQLGLIARQTRAQRIQIAVTSVSAVTGIVATVVALLR